MLLVLRGHRKQRSLGGCHKQRLQGGRRMQRSSIVSLHASFPTFSIPIPSPSSLCIGDPLFAHRLSSDEMLLPRKIGVLPSLNTDLIAFAGSFYSRSNVRLRQELLESSPKIAITIIREIVRVISFVDFFHAQRSQTLSHFSFLSLTISSRHDTKWSDPFRCSPARNEGKKLSLFLCDSSPVTSTETFTLLRGPGALLFGKGLLNLTTRAHSHPTPAKISLPQALSAYFVNVGDERGETPLHLAARRRWTECVRVLLDHGALVSSSTREYGRIPYSVAIKHNHGACAALLNPSVAEPLVWPSPLKFISELDPNARALLEVALMDANKESEKIILNERKKLLSPANVDEAFHDDASELNSADLIAKGNLYTRSREDAASKLLEKALKIQLGRGF
ncbi:hypothetical protein ZIOFF_070907 [Zingiber officinale]|uniref:Uncharacterized protein n=1 Tax=Zingiber officinale TaxID=94328 RepID=A0A8J5EQ66_ZINOF|nr:hypothetical protein ZIOFF_070907 [Zingiber officinale]